MIPMPPNPIPLEQIREPQARRYLFLRDNLIPILRLTNHKLANLQHISHTVHFTHKLEDLPATPYP